MRLVGTVAFGLIAGCSLPSIIERAHAQATQSAEQPFVPGELIVGYESDQARREAMQKAGTASDSVQLRGERPAGVQVEELGETALIFHIEFPDSIKQATRGNPASELALLRELGARMKQSDSRIKYAHPNWLTGINPPPSGADAGLKPQSFSPPVQSKPPSNGPNDPMFGQQWHYEAPPTGMNAVGAWSTTHGDRSIVVAVLDSGIVADHEDIKGSGNLAPGYNFVSYDGCTKQKVNRSGDPTDPGDNCDPQKSDWHGTHVAGMIGAAGSNNGLGIAAIAWNVTVVPVRVIGHNGSGTNADLAAGIEWASGHDVAGVPKNQHPADVINMSLGGPLPCTEEDAGDIIAAINDARKAGTVVVVAAGNGAWQDPDQKSCDPATATNCTHVQEDVKGTTPGGCPGVISVAASDRDGKLAYYSNFGNVTLMAPGGDTRNYRGTDGKTIVDSGLKDGVWSTVKGSYGALQGTSQATPHVTGAIALALSVHPDWRHNPDLVEAKLKATSVNPPTGACPADKPCGAGQLDAARLLAATRSPFDPPPVATSAVPKFLQLPNLLQP